MLTIGEHCGFFDFQLHDSEIIQPQLSFVVLLAIILRNLRTSGPPSMDLQTYDSETVDL
jgi:hypothetical protein